MTSDRRAHTNEDLREPPPRELLLRWQTLLADGLACGEPTPDTPADEEELLAIARGKVR